MKIREISKVEVFFDEEDNRTIRCFCGEICKRTLVPHLKKDHPEIWEEWCLDFVRLRNKGWSHRRIMWKYRAIFSWTVIEREIKRMVEEGKATLKVRRKARIKRVEPTDFRLETTTLWSFPKRGEWGVHQSDYRGNWPPLVPRNLILRYTEPEDVVFDPFVGGGTTLFEAYQLGRQSVGIDINPSAKDICEKRIEEMETSSEALGVQLLKRHKPQVILGDARDTTEILSRLGFKPGEVDLICTHPPYLNAIRYTESIPNDISRIRNPDLFCDEIQKVAEQLYTFLRSGGRCAILIGDVRRRKKIIPLGFRVMDRFLHEGFEIEEIIIKEQHKDESTEFYYGKHLPNYLIAHEYLFVFQKP